MFTSPVSALCLAVSATIACDAAKPPPPIPRLSAPSIVLTAAVPILGYFAAKFDAIPFSKNLPPIPLPNTVALAAPETAFPKAPVPTITAASVGDSMPTANCPAWAIQLGSYPGSTSHLS